MKTFRVSEQYRNIFIFYFFCTKLQLIFWQITGKLHPPNCVAGLDNCSILARLTWHLQGVVFSALTLQTFKNFQFGTKKTSGLCNPLTRGKFYISLSVIQTSGLKRKFSFSKRLWIWVCTVKKVRRAAGITSNDWFQSHRFAK